MKEYEVRSNNINNVIIKADSVEIIMGCAVFRIHTEIVFVTKDYFSIRRTDFNFEK